MPSREITSIIRPHLLHQDCARNHYLEGPKKDAPHGLTQLRFSPQKETAILNNVQLRPEWGQ